MKFLFTSFIFICLHFQATAQVPPPGYPFPDSATTTGNDTVIVIKEGVVQYYGDARINELMETKKKLNKRYDGIKGYRIQLYSGDRKTANEFKADFLNAHEDIGAYIVYEQPYFKTRVGNFRTKIDAERALQKIAKEYPGSFILADFIVAE